MVESIGRYRFNHWTDPAGTEYNDGDSASFTQAYIEQYPNNKVIYDFESMSIECQGNNLIVTFPKATINLSSITIDNGRLDLDYCSGTTFTATFRYISSSDH